MQLLPAVYRDSNSDEHKGNFFCAPKAVWAPAGKLRGKKYAPASFRSALFWFAIRSLMTNPKFAPSAGLKASRRCFGPEAGEPLLAMTLASGGDERIALDRDGRNR